MIAYWAENRLFRPMSLYVSGRNLDVLPTTSSRPFANAGLPEPSPETVRRARNEARLRSVFKSTGLKHFSPTAATGRPGNVTVADFALYHALWFLTARTDRLAFELEGRHCIQAWMARVADFGHGTRQEMKSRQPWKLQPK